ncbi:hypothetical protein [Oricola indica]|uniref:hypothetical protein n=1 Tax=Oricola indica TaxID=2872591 RepID=UPI003CCC1CC8
MQSGILRPETVRLAVEGGRLSYEAQNRAAIDAYWADCKAANPRLWNGPFFMFEEVSVGGSVFSGRGRRTDFATFLHWRDHGRPPEAVHVTGTSLPVTADGALFAVRMAAHTANAGAVYFPAGSFDAEDIVDGSFDVTRNIAREMGEETGLVFDENMAEGAYTVVADRGAFHVARRSGLPGDFDACLDLMRRHQARTGDDELETAIAVRAGGEGADLLKPYARLLADWHFENAAFSCSG